MSIADPARSRECMAFTLGVFAAVFWGSNFEATRIVLDGLPPWTAAAGRFVLAAAAILLWLRVAEGPNLDALRRNATAFVVLGVVGVAGFNATLFLGMRTSSPVTAALIMGTSPLATNLLDALISRRRPGALALVGMGVSLLGVALTVGAFSGTHFSAGDILILLGSLLWSLYTIGCRRWVRDSTPRATAACTMAFGAVALVLAAVLLEDPVRALAAAPGSAWAALLWMASFGSVLAYLFWQVGVAVRGPAATSVLFNLVPISALLIAAFLGRVPHPSQIAGVALAIFGVLLVSDRLVPPAWTWR